MEILDKKSNRMSRANSGVSECNEFPDLQRILDFLSLRNLLSNELFFTFYEFTTASFLKNFINLLVNFFYSLHKTS
ncbi:riboflavin synthase subunit alpha [Fusobacterium pseudoperiodonticum]|uniref:Riboflavin synthase subunit alpha n=1 Tax=Fusobacterium pseudoperiodonticum TaxID=2663009 RepID=A0A2G9ECD0_9FUSO|nr:riboflavin synthase subunit alpha [Fusobacterium pseudoperiodonticum]ATV65147.1 riboflavin synthase subunit alpha [Fusobacterium pseudoperiodonticum]ATV72900.1 riboflavin synthase subunit alpha [Fusobacterium pseudoperiodonticum]PIM78548.1 riboflavin synthase subunit alpha [Fusobacterium pseudoperiodonticum]